MPQTLQLEGQSDLNEKPFSAPTDPPLLLLHTSTTEEHQGNAIFNIA